uniref:Neuropeptide DH45 n=1 Tax=Diaphorina citri TaxID=121845 RepID=A0A2U9PFR2_DIACI|nr:neuropeptide DH45 [Diaphorina citri]
MSLVTSRVVPILLVLLSLSPRSRSSEIIHTIQELNPGPSDAETTQFLLPKLAEKYSKFVSGLNSPARSEGDQGPEDAWDDYVYDPKLFLLTESEEETPSYNYAVDYRDKREALISSGSGNDNMLRTNWKNNGPSLSIVNPLDVLRQRLLLEIARRRQEKSQSQINENRKFLSSIGKRNFQPRPAERSGFERASGNGQSRGFDLRVLQPREFGPNSSFSRWTSSLAEFPRATAEHARGHRNYNRHVN